MTPWAHILWRWCVLSRGRRSLTAPRSRVIISLPMAVYPCLCIRLSRCDWWDQKKWVFGGGEASLATSDEEEPGEEEEEEEAAAPMVSASLFLLPLIPPHSSTCLVPSSIYPASCCPQSSSSLDTLVAMSLKANGAPHRRLNLTPLLWPSPLGSWQTSASKATRAPAAPWVQDRRKGPARWTWQPQPCAASRSASTTSAGSRGLRTLTSQPHRGVRGSAAF